MIGKRNQLSNRKEQGWISPTRAPSGSVLLVNHSSTHAGSLWQARAFTIPAPIPPAAGPENLQCRAAFIHSLRAVVPKRQALRLLPGSNPLLTRDTVASPAKCVSQAAPSLNQAREQPLPITSQSSRSNPFAGWRLLSKFMACSSSLSWWLWRPVRETSVPGHSCTFWP